jgi:hypothetical protein
MIKTQKYASSTAHHPSSETNDGAARLSVGTGFSSKTVLQAFPRGLGPRYQRGRARLDGEIDGYVFHALEQVIIVPSVPVIAQNLEPSLHGAFFDISRFFSSTPGRRAASGVLCKRVSI